MSSVAAQVAVKDSICTDTGMQACGNVHSLQQNAKTSTQGYSGEPNQNFRPSLCDKKHLHEDRATGSSATSYNILTSYTLQAINESEARGYEQHNGFS